VYVWKRIEVFVGRRGDVIGRVLDSNQGEDNLTASLVRAYVLVMAMMGFQPALAVAEEFEPVEHVVTTEYASIDSDVYEPTIVGFDAATGVMELIDGTAEYEPIGQVFRYTTTDGTEVTGTVANIQIDRAAFHFSATFMIENGPYSGTYQVSMGATDADAGLGMVLVTDSSNTTTATEFEPQMYSQAIGGVATRLPSIPMHPGIGIIVVVIAIFIVAEEAIRGDDPYNCAGFAY